ncbi:MAG: hypothetical protein LBU65_09710 [Planctomycetaceae bacterium]|nr:hypothetical protein [Planctomycetaceae bacterium]
MKRLITLFTICACATLTSFCGCDKSERSVESYGTILKALPQNDDAGKNYKPPVDVDLNVDFSNDPFLN